MAVGIVLRVQPNSHFFAMHKTYGTLCKNQEEQDWCYMQEEKRTLLSPQGDYLPPPK